MRYTHNTAPTQHVQAGDIGFAYRRFGTSEGTPLVFLQHFMGNLDDHDPAITDALSTGREVILFNNAGVASSTGTTPDTIEQTALDAEAFIDALGLEQIDLLAHSMGGLVAQQIATDRPDLVRKLILVGTGPRGGEGIGEMPAETAALFSVVLNHQEEMWLPILFAPSKESQTAGREFLDRIMVRPDHDAPVKAATVQAQSAAIHTYGTRKDPSYAHLAGVGQPTLVVNGNNDIVIATINSYILQQHMPNATLVLYPDANHGSHFQYHARFVKQAQMFLDEQ